MAQLTKGMYGSEFSPTSDLFGLRCGQMCWGGKLSHNGGWYNSRGEKLGWGDLSTDDLRRIASNLQAGEVFVVVPEHDSYWNFVQWQKTRATVGATVEAPGVEYVAQKAQYVVTAGCIYRVDKYGTFKADDLQWGTLRFDANVSRETAKVLMTTGRLP